MVHEMQRVKAKSGSLKKEKKRTFCRKSAISGKLFRAVFSQSGAQKSEKGTFWGRKRGDFGTKRRHPFAHLHACFSENGCTPFEESVHAIAVFDFSAKKRGRFAPDFNISAPDESRKSLFRKQRFFSLLASKQNAKMLLQRGNHA